MNGCVGVPSSAVVIRSVAATSCEVRGEPQQGYLTDIPGNGGLKTPDHHISGFNGFPASSLSSDGSTGYSGIRLLGGLDQQRTAVSDTCGWINGRSSLGQSSVPTRAASGDMNSILPNVNREGCGFEKNCFLPPEINILPNFPPLYCCHLGQEHHTSSKAATISDHRSASPTIINSIVSYAVNPRNSTTNGSPNGSLSVCSLCEAPHPTIYQLAEKGDRPPK